MGLSVPRHVKQEGLQSGNEEAASAYYSKPDRRGGLGTIAVFLTVFPSASFQLRIDTPHLSVFRSCPRM